VRVPPGRRNEAVQALLRADRDAAERFVRFADEQHIRLDAMWTRPDASGRFALTVLASPGAGRTATLFATAARTAADVTPLAHLIAHVINYFSPGIGQGSAPAPREFDLDLLQALVDPSEFRQAEALTRAGMLRLAELSYLERVTPRVSSGPPIVWPDDLTVETWDPSRRDELIHALERSYVGTLDCPLLAGVRRGADVLDGHLHSGTFEPSLWTVLRFSERAMPRSLAGQLAGMCLFNSSSPPSSGTAANDRASGASGVTAGSLELVYLGLVPEVRGRGIGKLLLRQGLDGLRQRREGTVVLAVDDRNLPAHRLYRDAGFHTRFRRIAFIRSLRADAPIVGSPAP
jgi:mycothiol synthase